MKLRYKQRLFLYFAIIFALFTVGVAVFEQSREKTFRTEMLEEKLDAYTEIVHAALAGKTTCPAPVLDSLMPLLPQNIRLSFIDKKGNVLFDNSLKDLSVLENHAHRPEIMAALEQGKGTDIRVSASNNKKYLYYAKSFGNYYIRVALPYDIQTQRFLKTDNLFLYFILALFVIVLLLLNVVTNRFGKSVRQLRDFVMLSGKDDAAVPEINFPRDELGEIGSKITESYRLLKDSQKKIAQEHQKLLQHIHTSEEGICFFTEERKVELYNGLFIQYLNTITDEPNSDPSAVFGDPAFNEMNRFLSENTGNYFETQIKKQGKSFSLYLNIFEDKGFEIILNDITSQEKTRLLKQEMTGNIAHELRTPVTSIRGYLETVLEQPLDKEKKQYFVTQAYKQAIVLSELIQDIGLITKMEEVPQMFKLEAVDIDRLLRTLKEDLSLLLQERKINMDWTIPENLIMTGNYHLLYAVFRNLTDNVIRYAGENIAIRISKYNEDKDFCYFSFYDTGTGISGENHLNRLFERFYRINEGRTRDTGGSGLGLSIVKNAIAFHKGTIVAKNRTEGGLEFLFKLKKNL